MMKAFSFLTILESLSKKLSILRTKMHSDDLRVNHGTITRVLRVSRPFSHCASRRASFALSRRASHFAAILTILFTVGVGNVFAQGTVTMPTSADGYSDSSIKYEFSNTASTVADSKIYFAQRNSIGASADYGWRPNASAFVFKLTGATKITVNVKSSTTSERKITGQLYTIEEPFLNIYRNTTIGASMEEYVISLNKKEEASRTEEEKAIVGISAFGSINSSKDSNKKLLVCESGEISNAATKSGSALSHSCPTTKGGTNSFEIEIANAGNYLLYLTSSGGSVGITSMTFTPTSSSGGETPNPDPGAGGDGDCPESGEIFALSGWSTSNTSEWEDKSLIETKITGLTTLKNGEVYAVSIEKDKKCKVDGEDENMAYSLGYNSVALRIDLDCELRVGDVITITSNGSHSNAFIFTNTGSRGNSVSSTTTSGTTKTYTVTEDDVLKGEETIYIWRSGSTVNIKAINITRPASSTPETPTYTLTNAVNPDGYGTVSPASVAGIPSGTTTSSSSNTYTVNGTTVTATPTANTAQYTYAFSNWSGLPATVTGNATVTANFTRTINKYTITWKNADGTPLETDNNVEYGTTPAYNGETPTKAADAENTYTFEGWSPEIATVTGNAIYTATFTATPIETPEPEPEPEDVAGEDFQNPERGFYEHAEWSHASTGNYNDNLGDGYFTRAAEANRSLLLRIYYLDTEELRQNEQLPAAFITMFNNDMQKIRSNGMKCILRFAYDKNSGDGFQDASPETWATHLAQLKPHLQANADVIYVVQAGFLGVWGEWYYSSLGTGNDEIELSIKNNLIDQLLAAVPANRCVQLRTPLFKKEYLGNNDPLTSTVAYKGTAQARLGHHNDAFLNGAANQGTYEDRETDMAYIAQECLYVPIGGETNLEESQVAELYEAYCKGTVAEAEMAQLHYSYLNHSYSTVVTNRWKAEGSYARMSKQLGYRFELESATLPNEATAGTQMNVKLNIKNVGYAPLYNERYAYIVLKNNTNTYSIKLSSDPRTWAPNKVTTTINENVTLPATMVPGTYDLYLYLPDASASIAANPKYAVRFANKDIWQASTGYNILNKQVVVTATDLDTYTITFKNGETVLQTSTIEYGAIPEYTGETPTKAEDAQYTYIFSGWDPAITAVTGDATYTATFAQTAKTYTLAWDVNGGNALTGDYTTGTVAYGTTIAKPADPTREGYTFAGWSPTFASTMPANNVTYTAQWEEIKVASITVNPTTLDLKKGESATLTATVSPNNALNKTVTWDNTSITELSATTGNTITVTGNSNGKDKELKASAGGKQATVKVFVYYEVQYNSNGGSECTSGKYYDDNNGVTLPTPTRDGYTFAGWYKNEALTQSAGAAGDTYKPSDNITLYAKWTVAKTNPTTTWTVAETAYAGQLVTVSVTTNSDATLTTGSLTTNKGTLVNATVNGKTITATLQVPDDASDDITLTLTTVATENYNASTSTKTITLSECPTNGGGGEEVIYSMYLTGQTACSVTGGTASLSKVSSTTLTVNKKSYYKFDSSTKITISPTNGIKSGDKLIVDIASTDANAVGFYLKNSDNTLATCTTTIAKESATTITYTFTKDVPIVDITRTDSNLRFYGASITRASGSGSGESTLETNLAWSTYLSAEVSKQAGTTFTNTASSDNSAGAITYSSSNTSVATVNQTTGEVITKAAGTAIITANIAESGCYPTKSITYTLTVTSTGEPEPMTYPVTYNLGGGTGTLPTQAATTAGSTFTLASADGITKDGYDFAGWFDGTNTYEAGTTYTMPANDVTLTAQWTAVIYNIKYFEAIGDDATAQDLRELTIEGAKTTYTIEDAVTLPALPAKDGYTAAGWYTKWCVFEDGGTGKGWNGCEPTFGHSAGYYGHANYIVKYTPDVPAGTLYTVTVNSATNGTVTADPTTGVAQGETVTLIVTPAIGYELGTLTVKDASNNDVTVTNNTFIMPASNVIVSATFTAIETPEPGECEILVNAEITAKNAASVTEGKWSSDATVTASVQDEGNGTKGWKLGANGHYFRISLTENTFKAGDIVTINLGTGGEASPQLVLYSDNGVTEIGSKTSNVTQGDNEITLTKDSKIINLYRNSTLGSQMNPWVISMSVKRCSIPVTPDPEPGSYTLTYNENQPAVWVDDFAVKNIPAAQTLPNGTGNVYNGNTPVITEDADSDYPIYTFIGWNTAANGSGTSYAAGAAITITENTTLYAQWTPCTFDVKYFDYDRTTPLEGMVNTTYTFGVGIPNLPTPTKPGQTFIGWTAFWDGGEREEVTQIEQTDWGVLQLAARWEVNCNMPTTTFANTRYTIGGALDLSTLISNNNSGGAITYAVTGGVAATINGSSFTCDRIGVVTVTATQAANGGNCEKIMTATINVAMPVTDGCAQMFTFKANDAINNPDGQKGSSYLDLSSYATINGWELYRS